MNDQQTDPARRRERLRELLGLGTTPSSGARISHARSGQEDRAGREQMGRMDDPPTPADGAPVEVALRGADGSPIPALLLRPDPALATGAAAVLVAGHGRGIDDLVRTDPADDFHDGLAHKLVRAGLTVLCPEMVSFGRRRVPRADGSPPYEDAESSCGIDAARHLLHGTPVMGQRVADARAAVTALRTLDGVDPDRVAVVGGSGGGAVALLLAAVDTSISAALVASFFCTFEASLCSIRHCPCNIIPGLLPDLEMADIAALIAPRHLILEAGERDDLFPVHATIAAHRRLAPVWAAHHAPAPELVITDGGHAFRAERSLEALQERLG